MDQATLIALSQIFCTTAFAIHELLLHLTQSICPLVHIFLLRWRIIFHTVSCCGCFLIHRITTSSRRHLRSNLPFWVVFLPSGMGDESVG